MRKNYLEKIKNFFFGFNKREERKKAMVIALVVIGICLISLFTPIYNVDEFITEGTEKISRETLIKASGISYGESIFKADLSLAKERLSKVAFVDSVKVKRVFPNKIKIVVRESSEVAYISFVGNFVGIDEKGKILEIKQKEEDTQKPVIFGLSIQNFEIGSYIDLSDEDKKNLIFEMLFQIKQNAIVDKIRSIDVNDSGDIFMVLRSNTLVKLGENENIKYKIAYLKSILEKIGNDSGGTIDISDTSNVVYETN